MDTCKQCKGVIVLNEYTPNEFNQYIWNDGDCLRECLCNSTQHYSISYKFTRENDNQYTQEFCSRVCNINIDIYIYIYIY